MQNLIELANQVQELMQQFVDIGKERERLRALNTRAQMIRAIRVKVGEVEDYRNKMGEGGIALAPMPKASKALIATSHKVEDAFRNNWEKAVNSSTLKTHFIDPTNEHVEKKLLKGLHDSWREYVDDEAPAIKKDWLDRLPNRGFGDAKKNISVLLAEISGLRSELPADVLSIKRVKKAAEEAGTIFAELDSIPETVRAFLAKAARGDALITDLSEDVTQWLGDHEMLNQLRVRFG
jgi:hypothetical protein